MMKLQKRYIQSLRIFLIPLPFIIAFSLLFFLHPGTFSRTWAGRTYYLFFVWLMFLEIILDFDTVFQMKLKLKSLRTLLLALFSFLPTLYVTFVEFLGLGSIITDFVNNSGAPFIPDPLKTRVTWTASEFLLSLEYLVFTILFLIIIWLLYRKKGFKIFSSSMIFIGAIGSIYMIDTLYPFGYFSPLQAFVPFTASLAASVLNWIGYGTSFVSPQGGMTVLAVTDSSDQLLVQYAVGWPCAGVQSLLIYTFVMLIFLKKMLIPKTQKIIYFVFGAIITYCINILRIVGIYLVYINNLNQGASAARVAADTFHSYYGGLFGMTWIVLYPLVIIGSRSLWSRIKSGQFNLKMFQSKVEKGSSVLKN